MLEYALGAQRSSALMGQRVTSCHSSRCDIWETQPACLQGQTYEHRQFVVIAQGIAPFDQLTSSRLSAATLRSDGSVRGNQALAQDFVHGRYSIPVSRDPAAAG